MYLQGYYYLAGEGGVFLFSMETQKKKKKKCLFVWLCRILVAACQTSFPDQGSNPGLQHWDTES